MSRTTIYRCDVCGEQQHSLDLVKVVNVVIESSEFDGSAYTFRYTDTCPTCREELKRVLDRWLYAQRKQ